MTNLNQIVAGENYLSKGMELLNKVDESSHREAYKQFRMAYGSFASAPTVVGLMKLRSAIGNNGKQKYYKNLIEEIDNLIDSYMH